ncbi:MAG: 4-(cytidine 5'-diphospho)-2-C-methyl-D-erythritol kinase, partial [Candidatus Margulisbacteria bacterium]|nr:4-(cytidine 5'-diphospho)-2-C-methyl-D-erythritol kinase [Candidatus Margulisiibacteriota bacterium]
MIQTKAHAKINLLLDILGTKGNLHEMCMIMQTVSLCDELSFEKIDTQEIIIYSNNCSLQKDNIIAKAYSVIQERFPQKVTHGFNVKLMKNIPMGAGLAGGSADAAAAVKVFLKELGISPSKEELLSLLLSIGSDVSFCYFGGTKLVTSRGEQLQEIEVELPKYFLLVNPDIQISTKEAFADWDKFALERDYKPRFTGKLIEGWEYYNAFELSVFSKYPVIKEIKETLLSLDATFALMTGSGSTVVAGFNDEELIE